VQTGYGRTGRFWGYQHFGIRPDIIVTAKGLASGFPLSGIAASGEIMAKGWTGSQGGTYGGNAVACAAALATLDVIQEEGLVENARMRGAELMDRLRKVAADHPVIGDVRGLGLMIGSEFTSPEGQPDPAAAPRRAEGRRRARAAPTHMRRLEPGRTHDPGSRCQRRADRRGYGDLGRRGTCDTGHLRRSSFLEPPLNVDHGTRVSYSH
jgi:acetylornithine/succinyldiaminopimelate/putrescine aminotransferase